MSFFSLTTRQCSLFVSIGGYLRHHQPGQLSRGQRRDNLIPEAPPGQEQQSPPVVQMGMGKQHRIDTGGIKAEGFCVFDLKFTTPLYNPQSIQYTATVTLD